MTQESFVLPKEKMACSLGQGKTTERRQQTKPPWINVTKVVLSLPKDTCQKSLKEGLPNKSKRVFLLPYDNENKVEIKTLSNFAHFSAILKQNQYNFVPLVCSINLYSTLGSSAFYFLCS